MGQELDCKLRLRKRTLKGRAHLETDYILFRGDERVKVPFTILTGVQAAGGVLRLEFPGGPAELELGAAAEKWAHKILHPPSRLDKLGVKAGLTLGLVGDFDDAFRAELAARNVSVSAGKGKRDLVIFAALASSDLQNVPELIAGVKPAGALWVIYPKGVTAIREIDVLEAGRAAGLKDIKVCSFSATQTGLKFVRPAKP